MCPEPCGNEPVDETTVVCGKLWNDTFGYFSVWLHSTIENIGQFSMRISHVPMLNLGLILG